MLDKLIQTVKITLMLNLHKLNECLYVTTPDAWIERQMKRIYTFSEIRASNMRRF